MKLYSLLAASLILTSQAFGSCYETYSEKLQEVNTKIAHSNFDKEMERASMLSTVSSFAGLAAVSTSTSGSLLFTTSTSAVTYASSKVSDFYIDLRIEDDIKKAVHVRNTLENSLALLKEARIGKGPMLQRAMGTVNNTISTDISMKNLADTIKAQDNLSLYCQNEESILSADGILKLAMDELAR